MKIILGFFVIGFLIASVPLFFLILEAIERRKKRERKRKKKEAKLARLAARS